MAQILRSSLLLLILRFQFSWCLLYWWCVVSKLLIYSRTTQLLFFTVV